MHTSTSAPATFYTPCPARRAVLAETGCLFTLLLHGICTDVPERCFQRIGLRVPSRPASAVFGGGFPAVNQASAWPGAFRRRCPSGRTKGSFTWHRHPSGTGQVVDIAFIQFDPCTAFQAAGKHDSAITNADQPTHGMTHCLKHAAHLTVTPFRNGDPVPAIGTVAAAIFNGSKLGHPVGQMNPDVSFASLRCSKRPAPARRTLSKPKRGCISLLANSPELVNSNKPSVFNPTAPPTAICLGTNEASGGTPWAGFADRHGSPPRQQVCDKPARVAAAPSVECEWVCHSP